MLRRDTGASNATRGAGMGKRGFNADEDIVAAARMVSHSAIPATAIAAAVGHPGWLA
jgi:hypothetical protein